ncbi:MAG TPA: methyltransferase domain-containing protein [Candidatus Polarisedimenticolaceae bacterium]|nr:methyltransferase domain-containing protein [Candidatus Polarisedimenticolaceae bacterium]
MQPGGIERWLESLEERHLRELTFPEVRRALQALSALYIGGRDKLPGGVALEGRGKRAAFALFYAPLHFLTTADVVRELGWNRPGAPRRILDLGCGTGAAGAAWALGCGAALLGIDRSGWALEEAAWTWRALHLRGAARRGDLSLLPLRAGEGVIAGWSLNELPHAERETLLPRLLGTGGPVLILEPIARGPVPWWKRWSDAFRAAGGEDREWRFRSQLPDLLARLDRAAGLDHRERRARSLSLWSTGTRSAPR